MPLTLSHPAAVLPLRRLGLPFTAVVIGSMVPDVPLFVGWRGGYEISHSLVGVATVDACSRCRRPAPAVPAAHASVDVPSAFG